MKKKIFDDKLSKAIGERVSKLRKSTGMNQDEVIKVLQIDRSTYSKIETGQIMVGSKYVIRLAEFFGVSTDFILSGKTTLNLPDFGKYIEDVTDLLKFMLENPSYMHHVLSDFYAKLEVTERQKGKALIMEKE
ncbi:MAG: helix-turn-helix domain-containing protein [Candidatus Aminicenantes bacterium]|nr:helix-turn-helix domain-containing protein [Candidatus Aminicenantes bacterium]NIM78482.1 helix-turn-helix domain-containing protein [Candidatus Aminicenantes bacterium]NIN19903.1 helix-turn-helix domain-containing protein [Candidatus Aminicenantes bacterium]NIN41620.1 helix-turn-helix domain-containing protein [Candidatus Aminicenantes bacterium]NIN86529.1 helix-turn-helix domain-containing protein [Candidatus Aminicenantes bacterium]